MFRRIYYNSVGQVSSDVYETELADFLNELIRNGAINNRGLDSITFKYNNGEVFIYLKDS